MGKARRTRQSREQERRRARTRRMLIATGAAVVVVLALITVQQLTSGGAGKPDPGNLVGAAEVQAEFGGLTERAGTLGPASAKITIIEYGDLRCPLCKRLGNNVIPQVISEYVRTGRAKLQFKTWPILGPNSVTAAQAAYAARRQNRLWRYAALTYLNQGDESQTWFTRALARALAAGVGLDGARFERDFASPAANAAIGQVSAEAERLGLPGTPSIRVIGPRGAFIVPASYGGITAGVRKAGGTAG